MLHDVEEARCRALAAVAALDCLFESIPPGSDLPSHHVAALFGLLHDHLEPLLAEEVPAADGPAMILRLAD